jgi:tetratricopeptide (TPR) repeat protein
MSKVAVEKVHKWIEKESNSNQETELKNAQNFLNSSSKPVESKTVQYFRDSVAEGTKFKEHGNKQFESQQFEEATKSYTFAISLDPKNAIYYANRAMALIKLNRFKEALGDCDQAIQLDPKYVKAFVRRASVHAKLSHFTEAYLDYLRVLEFEPSNAQAKKEIQVLTKGGKVDMKIVEKANKPAVGGATKEQAKPQQTTQTKTQPIPQKATPTTTPTTTSSTTKPTVTTSTTEPSSMPQPQSQTANKTQTLAQPKEMLEPKENKLNEPSVKPIVQSKRDDDGNLASTNNQVKKKLKVTEVSTLELEMEDLRKLKKLVPTTPPAKYPEFEQIWSSLHEFNDRSQYFKIIQHSDYDQVFSESLDSNIFDEFMKILLFYLKEGNNKDVVVGSLKSLSNLKRFSLLVMFMSGEIKKVLKEIFEIIGDENGLKQKYL